MRVAAHEIFELMRGQVQDMLSYASHGFSQDYATALCALFFLSLCLGVWMRGERERHVEWCWLLAGMVALPVSPVRSNLASHGGQHLPELAEHCQIRRTGACLLTALCTGAAHPVTPQRPCQVRHISHVDLDGERLQQVLQQDRCRSCPSPHRIIHAQQDYVTAAVLQRPGDLVQPMLQSVWLCPQNMHHGTDVLCMHASVMSH